MEGQYYLSRKTGINISESNNIPYFEFEIYIGMLENDLAEELKQLEVS